VTRATQEERRVVSENVLRNRVERGWTQKRLAQESGVNPRTIRSIERQHASAHEGTLVKLAVAFRLSDLDELFTHHDPAAPLPPPLPPVPKSRSRQREVFNLDVDELKRALARLERDDPAAGERAYRMLSARIRTLTLAVRKERWKGSRV
jgi:transcriptional regulator with XRE-family HTH domain